MEPVILHTCAHSKSLSYCVCPKQYPFRAGIHPPQEFQQRIDCITDMSFADTGNWHSSNKLRTYLAGQAN